MMYALKSLKPAKNVKHGLIGVIHAPVMARIYKDLYFNTRLNSEELRIEGHRRFKLEYPDVECTSNQLRMFALKREVQTKYIIQSELYHDLIWQSFEKHYVPRSKMVVSRIVFEEVNEGKRLCTLQYVQKVYDEYDLCASLPYVDNALFNDEWLLEYDDMLLSLYYSEDYCKLNTYNLYMDKLFKMIGKRFDYQLVNRRLISILPEPEEPTKLDIKTIPPTLIETIQDNISDFMKRNLSYSEIARKIQFFFTVEGYESTIEDVNNLLQSLNLTTN